MQEEQKEDLFRRQRRNLMLISVVLLLFQTTDIGIDKINILGNEFTLAEPGSIVYVLWVAFLYWLWRYYQIHRALGPKGYISEWFSFIEPVVLERMLQNLKRRGLIEPNYLTDNVEVINRARPFRSEEHWRARFLDAPKPDGGGGYVIHDTEGVLTNKQLGLRPQLIAWMRVAAHTPLVSEYALPFLIAALPIMYVSLRLLQALVELSN